MLCLSWLPFVLSHFKFDERVISLNRENSLCLASNVFIQKALSLFANCQVHINAEKKIDGYLWRLIQQEYQENSTKLHKILLHKIGQLIYLLFFEKIAQEIRKLVKILIGVQFCMLCESDNNLRCWRNFTPRFHRSDYLLLQKKEHKHKYISGFNCCTPKYKKL